MIIEITGTSVRNKGAELMLVAIREHFADNNGVELAVDQHFGSYQDRAQYGLLQKFEIGNWGRSRVALSLMPDEFRRAVGLVRDTQVDIILDASGFAFGDQHPLERIVQFADRIEAAKDAGKTVILLPQALGPFEKPLARKAFARVVGTADLIFARDDESMAHTLSVAGESTKNVLQAPDFTNLVTPPVPDQADLPGTVCLVPNQRMVEKADSPQSANEYVPFMARCARLASSEGMAPFLLVHGQNDAELASSIQRECQTNLPVVEESDPVRLKGILGSSEVVVGSRFHALVGSLSQGVPTIGTSWSHKYEMLFQEYGCDDMLLTVDASNETIQGCLEAMTGEAGSGFKSRLREAGEIQRNRTRDMWSQVDARLSGTERSQDGW